MIDKKVLSGETGLSYTSLVTIGSRFGEEGGILYKGKLSN